MQKIAIFNVGGALSSYVEMDDFKFLVDIGAGNDFSPVSDFLLPLAKIGHFEKYSSEKYLVSQLFLSHLDNDHISDYENFSQYFHPKLLTAPNDHQLISHLLRVSRDKISKNEVADQILRDMQSRVPGLDPSNPDYERPLAVCDQERMLLSYIPPTECEDLDEVSEEEYPHYCNNISLVLYIKPANGSILFPGDIMKDGIQHLINSNSDFRNVISNLGVDFLVAPHHGLDTSYPVSFFETVKNGKVRLCIISEKKNKKDDSDSRHNVDTRYYSPECAIGVDVLNGAEGIQRGIITSRGHIVIDFSQQEPVVKRCLTNDELIREFV